MNVKYIPQQTIAINANIIPLSRVNLPLLRKRRSKVDKTIPINIVTIEKNL